MEASFRQIDINYSTTDLRGGLDHVNPVIRLPHEHGIIKRGFIIYIGIIGQIKDIYSDNNRPGIVKPDIGNDVEFESNSNFMRELRRKLFAGTDDEDAHEHVQRVLEIVDLLHFPGVTHDAVMLKAHLTKECHLKKEDEAVEQSKYMRSLEETISKLCWDITIKDVERLRQFLTPTIHTLHFLEHVVQPYMPLEPVHHKEKIVSEKEHDYDIPLHDGVMQPLTPQIVYITPPDDDYVAPATSLTLDKQLNKFGKECSNITRVAKKANGNLVEDVQELSDIKTYDYETFIQKLLH
ncbi:hypothetical protein Tco_0644946 [Tanacetum coccineum]